MLNSLTDFPLSRLFCLSLFAKTLSIRTSGKYIWLENVYESFAALQSRHSQPASGLLLEMGLFLKWLCWYCLELTLAHNSRERAVVCFSIPFTIAHSWTFLLSFQPFHVVIITKLNFSSFWSPMAMTVIVSI